MVGLGEFFRPLRQRHAFAGSARCPSSYGTELLSAFRRGILLQLRLQVVVQVDSACHSIAQGFVLSIFRSSCECACECLSPCSASVLCILRETLARNAVNFCVFGLVASDGASAATRRRTRTADLNRERSAPCFCHGYTRLINAGEGSPGSGV